MKCPAIQKRLPRVVGHRPPRLSEVAIERLGDEALLIRIGERIELELNRFVHALDATLRAQRPAWLRDLVPAYASLAVHVDNAGFPADVDPLTEAERWVRERLGRMSSTTPPAVGQTIQIVVSYGGEGGPDLDAVAAHCGLSAREVVQRHTAVEYRVAMLGFAPGFPYLLGLDPTLAVPRLAQPRVRVDAGSVAIGGAQTGIYPRPGPGGWRVIGRTAQVLFDPQREPSSLLPPSLLQPSLLQPGDRVRFVAINVPA